MHMDTETLKLKSQLEDYLSRRLETGVHIDHMKSLTGGACQDNYLVDLRVDAGDMAGAHKLVMRSDKGGSLLKSLTRPEEYRVAEAAAGNGVETPRPYWLETDRNVIGRPFYFMQCIPGNANARYVLRDKSLNAYRKQLPDDLARNLAAIHGVTPSTHPELNAVFGEPPAAGSAQLAHSSIEDIRAYVVQLDEAHPAMELVLHWLKQNAPVNDTPVLVHGDFRTGNFMVSPDGLHGIVDWEFAHWGDRHEDVAWLCMRDWRFGKNKDVGGFTDREIFYDAYQKHSGVTLQSERVRYWEIMGNLRWAVGSAQQARRHLSGADKGIELAAIGRRTCEMEYEMLRLMENAG